MLKLSLAAVGFVTLLASQAGAAVVTINVNAADRGFYTEGGVHNPDSTFYTTGRVMSSAQGAPSQILEERSFFLFNIPAVLPGTLVGATLTLRLGSGMSDTGTETFTLFDVSTNLASLVAGTAGTTGFADLGSGQSFGSVNIAPVSFSFDTVGINLNSDALASILLGQTFALGGAVTSLSGVGEEYVFGGTGSIGLATLELQVDVPSVPLPGALPLFVSALAGFAVLARRRRG